jgi:O-antigen/teichoic acid export membrane protein
MGWICVGQGVTMILGLISVKLLTTMGLQEYGEYALVLSASAFLSSIFYGPVEQGFVRYYYNYADQGMARTFMGLFYKVIFLSISVLLILTLFGATIAMVFAGHNEFFFKIVAGAFVIFSAASSPLNSLLNVLRRRKVNAILQIMERTLAIALLYGVFYFDSLTTPVVFAVLSISTFLMIATKIRFLNSSINDERTIRQQEIIKYHKEMIKVIAKFSMPFGIWGVAYWLQSNSERWIIAKYLSVSDVGVYAVMIGLATYLVIIPYGVMAQFVTPIIYERFSRKADKARMNEGHQLLNYFVVFVFVIMLFSMILTTFMGREILLLISNSRFAQYWYILPFLCLGVGLFSVGQALTTRGMLWNVPQIYLFPKIASGVIAVIANILCLNLMGLDGIAVSVSVMGLIYMILVIQANGKGELARQAFIG